jgi:hypothetical protein
MIWAMAALAISSFRPDLHAAGGIHQKRKGHGGAVVAFESIQGDVLAFHPDLEVLLLEPLGEAPLPVENEDRKQDVFGPDRLRIGRQLVGWSRGRSGSLGGRRQGRKGQTQHSQQKGSH